jgi:hypothetical protein
MFKKKELYVKMYLNWMLSKSKEKEVSRDKSEIYTLCFAKSLSPFGEHGHEAAPNKCARNVVEAYMKLRQYEDRHGTDAGASKNNVQLLSNLRISPRFHTPRFVNSFSGLGI